MYRREVHSKSWLVVITKFNFINKCADAVKDSFFKEVRENGWKRNQPIAVYSVVYCI